VPLVATHLVAGGTFFMIFLKTEPFAHQLHELEHFGERKSRGLFWEMGCGKTKPVIDSAAVMYDSGAITGVVVLAPNGVHRNWTEDEIPLHMSEQVSGEVASHMWQTAKSRTNKHRLAADKVLKHDGLAVLTMTYSAVMTEPGRQYLRQFFKDRDCLYVLDEVPAIKTPGAKRTIRIRASAHHAPFRRILSGTLVDDNPFDTYSPMRFLDDKCWSHLGIRGAAEFRTFFGEWEKSYNSKQGREFQQLVHYKNLDILRSVLEEWGTHYLKKDVLPNLPPKLYSRRYFDLTPEQWRVYRELRDEFQTFLSTGESLTTPLAITRLIRMRQVLSGYLPSDLDDELRPIGTKNPRLETLLEVVQNAEGQQLIVWAVYRQDIDSIMEILRKNNISAVRYDGKCNDAQLFEAEDTWKAGKAQVFVSNPAVGGQGLTLNNAPTMIWYNNYYKLSFRRQGEDRNHRPGQKATACNIIDICAAGTIDELVIDALRKKQEVAEFVMGDEKTTWV